MESLKSSPLSRSTLIWFMVFLLVVFNIVQNESMIKYIDIDVISATPLTYYHPNLSFCEANNFIANASDTVITQTINNTRRFSIRKQDFQPSHLVPCETSNDLLQSIANGHRRWNDEVEKSNFTLLQKEDYPSTFIAAQCSIPYYTPDQVCEVLNRFSHIVIQGDSLSRHLQGGLLMALSGDIVRGAGSFVDCTCDAQFSSNEKCKTFVPNFNRFRPDDLGLCPNLANYNTKNNTDSDSTQQFESVFNINRLHKGVYKFPDVNCTLPESKGILVIVQGGVHMKWNAGSTYGSLIKPFFNDQTFRTCAKKGKAYFVWTSFTPQSPKYDNQFPLQKLQKGLIFNDGMKTIFRNNKIYPSAVVDWLNFTTGAMHTDGLHYAAQVNLFKAQHIIALVDRLWTEKRHFKLPD